MRIQAVRFNVKDQPEFFKELRKRVGEYFKENEISTHSNFNMWFKTAFMILLYFVPLTMMIIGVVNTFWPMMAMWVLMGFGMSGIGLSIMHDANHGSYSKNKRVNHALGYLINFVGGYHINWKIQHNVLHHTYTNVDGYDEDIEQDLMRFSPNQERKKFFRYQLFYAPFLYCLLTIFWVLVKDFKQLNSYRDNGLLEKQGLTYRSGFIRVFFNKLWYVGYSLVLPMVMLPLPWYQALGGWLVMHALGGLILALIFQPAHVLEETDFYVPDEHNSVENSWAIHQMRTTANFANGSHFFSWFVGGLNYQIEHHLFPHICHIHYKKISKIVKATAEEYGLPYYQHKTFVGALKSHFTLLHELGTGKYDEKKLAKAA